MKVVRGFSDEPSNVEVLTLKEFIKTCSPCITYNKDISYIRKTSFRKLSAIVKVSNRIHGMLKVKDIKLRNKRAWGRSRTFLYIGVLLFKRMLDVVERYHIKIVHPKGRYVLDCQKSFNLAFYNVRGCDFLNIGINFPKRAYSMRKRILKRRRE